MAQPTFYATSNKEGVDPNVYYVVSASLTPETPAPPFAVGEVASGSNGAEFVFVQASTSIGLGDFIAITNADTANSLTNTSVVSSLGAQIGMAPATIAGSVTLIPAGAYFWAVQRGRSLSGNANNVCSTAPEVQLFTSATAGAVTSVTTSSTLAAGVAGIQCISSTTPLWSLTWPRAVAVYSSAGGTLSLIANA